MILMQYYLLKIKRRMLYICYGTKLSYYLLSLARFRVQFSTNRCDANILHRCDLSRRSTYMSLIESDKFIRTDKCRILFARNARLQTRVSFSADSGRKPR